MAIYIEIKKTTETNDAVRYSFGEGDGPCGILEVSKASGRVSLVEPLSGDRDQLRYARAKRKIEQHVARGELPDATCWAS